MRIGTPESPTPWLTIVGEVADLKLSSPDDPTKEQFFGPVDQAEEEIGSGGGASAGSNYFGISPCSGLDDSQAPGASSDPARREGTRFQSPCRLRSTYPCDAAEEQIPPLIAGLNLLTQPAQEDRLSLSGNKPLQR
jgi:hypothetical protein